MSSPRLSSPSVLGAACELVFLAACTATASPTSTLASTSAVPSPTSTLAKTADPVPPVTPVSVTTLVALPTLAIQFLIQAHLTSPQRRRRHPLRLCRLQRTLSMGSR